MYQSWQLVCLQFFFTFVATFWLKKKRYAFLSIENVGNFQNETRGCIAAPRVYAWVAIVVSVSRFPTTINRDTAFATHASALLDALRVGRGVLHS